MCPPESSVLEKGDKPFLHLRRFRKNECSNGIKDGLGGFWGSGDQINLCLCKFRIVVIKKRGLQGSAKSWEDKLPANHILLDAFGTLGLKKAKHGISSHEHFTSFGIGHRASGIGHRASGIGHKSDFSGCFRQRKSPSWLGGLAGILFFAVACSAVADFSDESQAVFASTLTYSTWDSSTMTGENRQFSWSSATVSGQNRTDYYQDTATYETLTVQSILAGSTLIGLADIVPCFIAGFGGDLTLLYSSSSYDDGAGGYSSSTTQTSVDLVAGSYTTTGSSSSTYADGSSFAASYVWSSVGGYLSNTQSGSSSAEWGAQSVEFLGETYQIAGNSGTTWSHDLISNVSSSQSSATYSSPSGASLSLSQSTTTTPSGSTQVSSLSCSHPDLGSFSGTSSNSLDWSNLLGMNWICEPRSAPSFLPFHLWLDGALVTWVSGQVTMGGYVVDRYEGASGSPFFTISGSPHTFVSNGDQALITLSTGHQAGFQASTEGGIPINGVTIYTADPNPPPPPPPVPSVISGQNTLWVNGTAYPFADSVWDSSGYQVDTYTSPGLGTVTLRDYNGAVAFTASHNGSFLSGTLTDGHAEMNGFVVSVNAPPHPEVPLNVWIRGIRYQRVSPYSLEFSAVTEGVVASCLLSEASGTWFFTGSDPNGSFQGEIPNPVPAFFMLNDGDDIRRVPVLLTDSSGNVALPEPLTVPNANLPSCVVVAGTLYTFVGTHLFGGAEPHSSAYYASPSHQTTGRSLLSIRLNAESLAQVCIEDCSGTAPSVSKHAWFALATHLFRQENAASDFPTPINAVLATQNHIFWRLASPEGLPPSFLLNGQAWWFAGLTSQGAAQFHGLYLGQEMTVMSPDEEGNRLVRLVDPIRNPQAPGTETFGTLSPLRVSVRFRDGSLALRGDATGQQHAVERTDDFGLHTLSADLDILGNNLSFGLLDGDASVAGALFRFDDDGPTLTASLHSALSRPNARWHWWKSGPHPTSPLTQVMLLDGMHKLHLSDPIPPLANEHRPGITLDPTAGGTSSLPGVLRVRPGGGLSMGIYGNPGQP